MLLLNMDIRMVLEVHKSKDTYCAPMNIDIPMHIQTHLIVVHFNLCIITDERACGAARRSLSENEAKSVRVLRKKFFLKTSNYASCDWNGD